MVFSFLQCLLRSIGLVGPDKRWGTDAGSKDDEPTFVINIRMPDGRRTIPLEVEGSNTVSNVQGQIRAKEDIPARMQRLIFKRDQLVESRTLDSYAIGSGAVLDLALAE